MKEGISAGYPFLALPPLYLALLAPASLTLAPLTLAPLTLTPLALVNLAWRPCGTGGPLSPSSEHPMRKMETIFFLPTSLKKKDTIIDF